MMREEGFKTLMEYVRGMIRGERPDIDVVTARALEALRRQPLAVLLAELAASNCKIRGARGNTSGDVLDLLEQVRVQTGVSKQELSRRSGVSRGHIIALLGDSANPTLETIVRLAIGLGFPLEVVSQTESNLDDGKVEDELQTGMDEASPASEGAAWKQVGAFGVTMAGATLLPQLFRDPRAAVFGCGVLGAASLGVAVLVEDPAVRRASGLVAAGLLTGAAIGGLVGLVLARRSAQQQGEAYAR
ncbi:helix-turn-helix domain-containing protein [Nannocystis punicea]|uniref:Helix-turn-helix transcriptional regulator n=1 Tax=Nannocystis punicea TaxID=2995304 RepID=A0ABY7H6W5_9BACT|nr:helix-turn-helix transcriptional regulator [Nannocystis poenicansa]WAS95023.1 helix-turn-helix transcriptional regulator [Nannocystis poenicansa]